jgi:hypothetical protein
MKHLSLSPAHAKAIIRIQQFFESWSLPLALKEVDIIFKKAAGTKAWRPADPYRAVEFCRQLQQLTKAAFILSTGGNEELALLMIVKPGSDARQPEEPQHYLGQGQTDTAFNNFPRLLSRQEYRYPVRALAACCSYRSKKRWKQFYQQLAACALSSNSLAGYETPGKLFTLHRLVGKLVEACHLLQVRLGHTKLHVTA